MLCSRVMCHVTSHVPTYRYSERQKVTILSCNLYNIQEKTDNINSATFLKIYLAAIEYDSPLIEKFDVSMATREFEDSAPAPKYQHHKQTPATQAAFAKDVLNVVSSFKT